MDQRALPDGYLNIGAEYYAALGRLGLAPDGLMWAFDETTDEFVLVLVTQHIDHAGPLALFELLVKAYNSAATPRQVSPFILRIHSPAQPIVAELRRSYGLGIRFHTEVGEDQGAKRLQSLSVGDLTFEKRWVYHLHPVELKPVDRDRRWKRFRTTVEKLAA